MPKREKKGKSEREKEREERREEFDERVVHLARTAKVVKGGRRFAFRATVVVGDRQGSVGVGIGKAREVPDAIRKASDRAKKNMVRVPRLNSTIPHQVQSKFGAGRVLLLQESPARAELVDPAARRVVASIALEVPPGHPLARAWADPAGSRGEGAVFLANGHVIVAKEKDPPALIEFGPAGDRAGGFKVGAALAGGAAWPVAPGDHVFVPLATWRPDKALGDACADLSDLEVGPDHRLYVLSDRSAVVARVADLDPADGSARADAGWSLGRLDGKPEGLAFTAAGAAIVALDTRKARHNIVLLEPPIAAPG